jgi:hypothetical protein
MRAADFVEDLDDSLPAAIASHSAVVVCDNRLGRNLTSNFMPAFTCSQFFDNAIDDLPQIKFGRPAAMDANCVYQRLHNCPFFVR